MSNADRKIQILKNYLGEIAKKRWIKTEEWEQDAGSPYHAGFVNGQIVMAQSLSEFIEGIHEEEDDESS